MSLPNIADSILQLTKLVNTIKADISSLSNQTAKIKHSIELMAIKFDSNSYSSSAVQQGKSSTTDELIKKEKKLSMIQCEEKMVNTVSTLRSILKTFPTVSKIS
jgi:hypothetical protein